MAQPGSPDAHEWLVREADNHGKVQWRLGDAETKISGLDQIGTGPIEFIDGGTGTSFGCSKNAHHGVKRSPKRDFRSPGEGAVEM